VTDQPDLFTQMDQAADLMRRENPYAGKADMALLFRDIQKSVMPELTTEQYQDAFDDWLLHDLARWERRIAKVWDNIDAFAKANPLSEPFRCVCGAVLHNPGDSAVMAEHAPHVQAARRR
jgi:hypothetical protein